MRILQQVYGKILLITMNAAHRVMKASKSNQCSLIWHDLTLVPHARVILGGGLKVLINKVVTYTSKTLPPFLYLIIFTSYPYPTCIQASFVQLKLPSGYAKCNVIIILSFAGELEVTQPFNILPGRGVYVKVSSVAVP